MTQLNENRSYGNYNITESDIEAAKRGLGMRKLTVQQLDELMELHQNNTLFASRVIWYAAMEMRDQGVKW